jgi:hypothetical protein
MASNTNTPQVISKHLKYVGPYQVGNKQYSWYSPSCSASSFREISRYLESMGGRVIQLINFRGDLFKHGRRQYDRFENIFFDGISIALADNDSLLAKTYRKELIELKKSEPNASFYFKNGKGYMVNMIRVDLYAAEQNKQYLDVLVSLLHNKFPLLRQSECVNYMTEYDLMFR